MIHLMTTIRFDRIGVVVRVDKKSRVAYMYSDGMVVGIWCVFDGQLEYHGPPHSEADYAVRLLIG